MCAATLCIVHSTLPPFWGVPNLAIKWDALHRDPIPQRALIGSSRIYRQAIPSIIDSVIGQGRTFNAGYAATFPPATYEFLEQLLREERQLPEEILVELSNYMLFEEANLEDHRYWYYLGPREGWGLVRHALFLPNQPRTERLGFAARAVRATTCSLLGLGLADHLLAATADTDTLLALGPAGDGGLTLETLLRYRPDDEGQLARRATFRADTLAALRRAVGLRHLYERPSTGGVSLVHLSRLTALLDKAHSRGVRLRFVLPPLWIDRGEDLLALVHALPDGAVIDLCHPDSFPQFYRPENMFDAGHLNDRGARLFSMELARALHAPGHNPEFAR